MGCQRGVTEVWEVLWNLTRGERQGCIGRGEVPPPPPRPERPAYARLPVTDSNLPNRFGNLLQPPA